MLIDVATVHEQFDEFTDGIYQNGFEFAAFVLGMDIIR